MRGSSHAATSGDFPSRDLIGRVLLEQDDPVPVRIGECDVGAWRIMEFEPAVDGDAFILQLPNDFIKIAIDFGDDQDPMVTVWRVGRRIPGLGQGQCPQPSSPVDRKAIRSGLSGSRLNRFCISPPCDAGPA